MTAYYMTFNDLVDARNLFETGTPNWLRIDNLLDDITYGYKSHLSLNRLHSIQLSPNNVW
jgi:hypothetical protein